MSPIKEAANSKIDIYEIVSLGVKSESSYLLPTYYLLYFLLHDLLEFRNFGRFEKISWTFVLDYKDRIFIIQHTKFGMRIYLQDPNNDESFARQLAIKLKKTVKGIKEYFNFRAEEAVKSSKLNVENLNEDLYDRYQYLRSLFEKEFKAYECWKDKTRYVEMPTYTDKKTGITVIRTKIINHSQKHLRRLNWLSISCVEAFFSWTEHLFVHLAIIAEGLCNGEKVASLIGADWKDKFNSAISDESTEIKQLYDDLLIVRRQLRNFISHGAFGKDGNAFYFHSQVGAVPVIINNDNQGNKFSLHGSLSFDEREVMNHLDHFIKYLRTGKTGIAMLYTQDTALPSILTLASNGEYANAIKNPDSMIKFRERILHDFDTSMNMDW